MTRPITASPQSGRTAALAARPRAQVALCLAACLTAVGATAGAIVELFALYVSAITLFVCAQRSGRTTPSSLRHVTLTIGLVISMLAALGTVALIAT